MANVTTQRMGDLCRGVFQVLVDEPDGLKAKEVLSRLEKLIPPTEFEQSTYPKWPTIRRFNQIARFVTIPAVKAGWLSKVKGRWSLTETGRAAFKQFKDSEEFYRHVRKLYKEWEAEQPDEAAIEPPDEPSTITAYDEAEESAWTEIQTYLQTMNPYDFQRVVAGVLRAMGYFVEWIAEPGPDRGVDIIAFNDPLGTKAPRIKVAVRRRQEKATVDAPRSFMALLGDDDVGLFVSTSGFTRDAEVEARQQERRKIRLLDLEKLFDLWIEHYPKLEEPDRRLLPLMPVHFLAPSD
jgi:restriction system protein